MRYCTLVFIFVLLTGISHAQTSSPKKVLGSFVYDGSAYNYEFKAVSIDNYTFRITQTDSPSAATTETAQPAGSGDNAVTPAEGSDETAPVEERVNPVVPETEEDENADEVDFLFAEFSQDVFQNIFLDQMEGLGATRTDDDLEDLSLAIFIKIQTRLQFIDDEPITSYLILRRDRIKSFLQANKTVFYNGRLSRLMAEHEVQSVRVEIEGGAIKNIIAHFIKPNSAPTPRQYVEFKNVFPISLSGKFDPENLANVRLYCMNCFGYTGLDRYLKLSDLIAFDIELENHKEDYSPQDVTVELTPSATIAELRKEKRSRILEVSAFSDLMGIDQEEPNGLIQIEAKRRINLITQSRQVSRFESKNDIASKFDLTGTRERGRNVTKRNITYTLKRPVEFGRPSGDAVTNIVEDTMRVTRWTDGRPTQQTVPVFRFDYEVKNKKFRSTYFTVLNSMEPRLLFAKLEENNKFIDGESVVDGEITALKLFQQQLVSFGVSFNVFKINFPQQKFAWNFLSGGAYWFRSRIENPDAPDSESIPLNSSYWQLSTDFQFMPDSRWGLNLGVNWIKPEIWHADYKLSDNNALLQPYLNAFLKTNDEDRLFFRYRWTFEHTEKENNFTQIQVGYSMNLFKASDDEK